MVDFTAAIKRPFLDTKTAVIGMIIGMIPLLNIFVAGFGLKCAENTLNNKKELAVWDDFVDIIVKAVVAMVIGIIYMIPAGIVLALGVASAIPAIMLAMSGDMSALSGMMTSTGLMFIVAVILGVIAMFLLPMAIIKYLKNGMGAAFAIGEIAKKAFTAKYIISWIVSAVYYIIILIVVGIISIIPTVGIFIGTGIGIDLSNVTIYTIFAETYKEL